MEVINNILMKRETPNWFITSILCIVILLIYLILMIMFPYNIFIQSDEGLMGFIQINEKIIEGEYYRLFTSIWIHANVVHLVSNVLFLFIFGSRLEDLLGGKYVLLIFVFSGLVGNIVTLSLILVDLNFVTLGASGGVYGLLGALYFHLRGKSKHERRKALYLLLLFFMITIGQSTNFIAHISGIVGGISIIWIKDKF